MTVTSSRARLTAGRVEGFTCPAGKAQAFLWDSDSPTLALRATPTGRKTYVFESRLNGSTIRINIGTVADWPIGRARSEAGRLKMLIDSGTDPRELERQQAAAKVEAQRQAQILVRRKEVTGLDAWPMYLTEGQAFGFTERGAWGDRHLQDHRAMAAPGEPMKRGKGVTKDGALRPILTLPLAQIDAAAIEAWLRVQTVERPTRAALAFRLLRGFLNWCEEQPQFKGIVGQRVHASKSVRKLVRKPKPKDADCLQREHLQGWFEAVRADNNQTAAVFLQVLLLTGARRGEIAALTWEDVNLKFGGSLTLKDKVEDLRVIPLTPYVGQLLASLPRLDEWVFAHADSTGKQANVAHNFTYNHRRALAVAGLPHVSLHGLRRSFSTLAEYVETPAGVIAQIQGHAPSAIAEGHYKRRPLDLLATWHRKIEAWILEQAGVPFHAEGEPGKLRAVN